MGPTCGAGVVTETVAPWAPSPGLPCHVPGPLGEAACGALPFILEHQGLAEVLQSLAEAEARCLRGPSPPSVQPRLEKKPRVT